MSACASTCAPNGGLPSCGGSCYAGMCPPKARVPVIRFPAQTSTADLLAASLARYPDLLHHGQQVSLVSGTYYQFNGAPFVHLGAQDALESSANPIFPLSDIFYFRFRKYPSMGDDVAPDGSVPYTSCGLVVREGDFVMLDNVAAQRVLMSTGYPSPYNAPYVAAPLTDAVEHFRSYGTQSFANLRIVSDDFDPRLPQSEQPPVRTDGTKRYHLQFTRTAQNLALYPGQTPSPCRLGLSGYDGDGTHWVFLPKGYFAAAPLNDGARAAPAASPLVLASGDALSSDVAAAACTAAAANTRAECARGQHFASPPASALRAAGQSVPGLTPTAEDAIARDAADAAAEASLEAEAAAEV